MLFLCFGQGGRIGVVLISMVCIVLMFCFILCCVAIWFVLSCSGFVCIWFVLFRVALCCAPLFSIVLLCLVMYCFVLV